MIKDCCTKQFLSARWKCGIFRKGKKMELSLTRATERGKMKYFLFWLWGKIKNSKNKPCSIVYKVFCILIMRENKNSKNKPWIVVYKVFFIWLKGEIKIEKHKPCSIVYKIFCILIMRENKNRKT